MASPKHKTHVSGQAGFNKHALTQPNGSQRTAASPRVWLDYEALCQYFPDEVTRAEALGVTQANLADWGAGRNGRALRRWRRPFARVRRTCYLLEPAFDTPASLTSAFLAARIEFDGKSSLSALATGETTSEAVVQLLSPSLNGQR